MTLVEVVVAIALAAIVSIAMYGSAIYTMRQTARNTEHLYALQMVNSAAAKVRVARFSMLTQDNDDVPDDAFEKQFFETHVLKSDPIHPSSTEFKLTYKIKGHGKGMKAEGGSANGKKYDLVQASESAIITAEEYKGHLLVITGGAGANQVRAITKNNATKVHPQTGEKTVKVWVAKDLGGSENPDDEGSDGFETEPNMSSVYSIDYGLYCDVTVSWGNEQGYRKVTETVYVPKH
jgi:type II secretory pathway pseudopilin PulG